MKHASYQIISGIAGVLSLIAFSSIIYKVYITQNTAHVTYTWICLIMSSQLLFILYGLLNNSYGIYLPSTIHIFGIIYILFIKLKNARTKNLEDDIEYRLIKKYIL